MGITITHTNETMFFYCPLEDGATKDNEIISSVSEKKKMIMIATVYEIIRNYKSSPMGMVLESKILS